MPLAELFRNYTPNVVRVVCCALVSTVSTIFGVYTLSYAVSVVKIDRMTMLTVAIRTDVGHHLQRIQRRVVGALRRNVRHPRTPVRHGDRNPDRICPGRLRAVRRRRPPGQGTHRMGPRRALTLGACVIAAISAWTARETHRTEIHALGRR